MELSGALETYFRGEKQTALLMIGVGLALVAFAAWIWRTQSGSFAWAIVIPLALVGAGASIGGLWFARKTDAQVAELTARLAEDRAGTVASESERMAKVNANWPRLKLVWGVLAAVAVVLLLVVKKEWASGLGLALMLLVALLFFIDVFAERRAEPYTVALTNEAATRPR